MTLWMLLIAGIAIAVVNWRRDPRQHAIKHVWNWMFRGVIGAMWWQQSLWKLPPTYTDRADGTGGLMYWVGEMAKWSAFDLQGEFVKKVIQPNFYFLAPQVYATEVAIALSLMLGFFTRIGGLLGALMAANLWLGTTGPTQRSLLASTPARLVRLSRCQGFRCLTLLRGTKMLARGFLGPARSQPCAADGNEPHQPCTGGVGMAWT